MYSIRKNFVRIILSGILLGFNWILLFEAYEYTSVAVATLCYYMAPILVILVSPIVFREKLTHKKCLCILIAVIGMVLVSGVLQVQVSQGEWKGILLGLGAAGLYAMVVVLNKKMSEISPYDKTIGELLTAAVVLIPYICFTEDLSQIMISPFILVMLLVVGILHTGIAYAMYFGSMEKIHAQTVAILSYIDPVVAILLSACFLHETMKPAEIVGAVLVLGSTIVSELEVS